MTQRIRCSSVSLCAVSGALQRDAQHGLQHPLQGVQQPCEFGKRCGLRCPVGRVQARVDLAHHLERGGNRLRGVEVVAHRRAELLQVRLGDGRVGLRAAALAQVRLPALVRRANPLQRRLRLVQPLIRELQRRAVMHGQQEVANHGRLVLLAQLADGHDQPCGLGHLLLAQPHGSPVQPVAGERLLAVQVRLRLCNLVLMVREDEIHPARMDVERRAEILQAQRGAFDMPARASLAPWAVPCRLARLGGFPQREVFGVALALVDFDARARLHLLHAAPR
jgi:hypothetical protein